MGCDAKSVVYIITHLYSFFYKEQQRRKEIFFFTLKKTRRINNFLDVQSFTHQIKNNEILDVHLCMPFIKSGGVGCVCVCAIARHSCPGLMYVYTLIRVLAFLERDSLANNLMTVKVKTT